MCIELDAADVQSPEKRLENLLSHRLGSRIRDLRVVFQPEGVILQGRTSTYYVKQLAQHATMATVDVPIFANEIEVHYSAC
jgi:hypothetical protein